MHFKFNGKVDPFQEIKEFYGFIWSLGNFLFVLNSDPNWNSFRIFGYHSNRNARVHFNYHLQLLLNIHFNARVPSKCSALVCFHCFFFICWVFFFVFHLSFLVCINNGAVYQKLENIAVSKERQHEYDSFVVVVVAVHFVLHNAKIGIRYAGQIATPLFRLFYFRNLKIKFVWREKQKPNQSTK